MSSLVEGVVITYHGRRFGYDEQSEEIKKKKKNKCIGFNGEKSTQIISLHLLQYISIEHQHQHQHQHII